MSWNRIIKSINGYRYVYEQRTSRLNGRVRTESRYVGPAASVVGDPLGDQIGVKRVPPRVLYHGSRQGIQGLPRPSASASYGPGFYLASRDDAEEYARYDPHCVPRRHGSAAKYQGTVYAFDVSALDLLKLEDAGGYRRAVCALTGQTSDEVTPTSMARAVELWTAMGYDGLDVGGEIKPAVIVFPSSMFKLGDLIAYYTVNVAS